MKLQDGTKKMELKITGYEFPVAETDDKSGGYDANWLTVKTIYTENGETQTHEEAELLTWELLELAAGLSRCLRGDDPSPEVEFSFTEPFLFFKLVQQGEKGFFLEICRVLDHAGSDHVLSVRQLLSRKELSEVIGELLGDLQTYPQRW